MYLALWSVGGNLCDVFFQLLTPAWYHYRCVAKASQTNEPHSFQYSKDTYKKEAYNNYTVVVASRGLVE